MSSLARIILLITIIGAGCTSPNPSPPTLQTQQDSLSYAIGVMLAKNYSAEQVSLSPHMLALGLEDQQNKGGLVLSDTLISALISGLEAQLTAQREQARLALASKNLAQSRRFLTQNRSQPDIQELPSGIQYRILEAGNGAIPRLTNSVRVTYSEAIRVNNAFQELTAGTGTFALQEVIPGWADALIHMKPGARWELYVPPQLAYGEAGRGDKIPPNALLKFDLTLHEIVR